MFTFLRRRLAERAVRAARQQAALDPEVQAEAPARPDPQQVLRRLEWTVIKRLDGQLQGDYRSLFRGAGLVLADLREYRKSALRHAQPTSFNDMIASQDFEDSCGAHANAVCA